jgi:hypothetical protein
VLNTDFQASSDQNEEAQEVTSMTVDWEIEELGGTELINDTVQYLVVWKSSLVVEGELHFMRAQGEMDGEPEKRVVDGTVRSLVRWKPSLVPEDWIDAPELIRDFEVRFGGRHDRPPQ